MERRFCTQKRETFFNGPNYNLMKIVHKRPEATADVSSARGTAGKEFWQLVLYAVVLLIALYFIIGFMVDFVVSRISFETEAKIFKHYKLPEVTPRTPENVNHLKKAAAILETLRTSKKVPPLPYHLILIDTEESNAFAFPGGTVGITTGLVEKLNDEIKIAFVIGHELGHFHNRDHLVGLGRAAGFGIVSAILLDTGFGTKSFRNIIEFVLQRSYSQDREKKADQFGLELVYSLYGKVKGTDHLFKILHEEKKMPEWAYMFSTHPSPKERISSLEKYALELIGNKDI
jgi:Zn-dependent protease with chaperone function